VEASTTERRVLLAEPAAGGHHFNAYVRFAVRAMLLRGWQVALLTTDSARAHPAFALLQQEFGGSLRCYAMPHPKVGSTRRFSQAQGQLAYWKALRRGFRACRSEFRPDCVLITTMDGVDKAISILGSPFSRTRFFGIMIGLSHHWANAGLRAARSKDRVNSALFRRLLAVSGLRGVMSIDPTLLEFSQGLSDTARSRLFPIPDPGEVIPIDRHASRKHFGIRDDEFVILIYGEISLRKSIEGLANAWLELPNELSKRLRLVCAGVWRDEARNALRASRYGRLWQTGQLVAIDEFVDQPTESRLFAAADALWCAYAPGFLKPSAVLSQAASAGIPIIGSRGGLIGRIVQTHALGPTVDSGNASECAEALKKLAQDHKMYQQFCNNSKKYGQTCSAGAFGDAVCASVQEGLAAGQLAVASGEGANGA
jgi:glycosyltransferase involved in cell wall biosynthesis